MSNVTDSFRRACAEAYRRISPTKPTLQDAIDRTWSLASNAGPRECAIDVARRAVATDRRLTTIGGAA